MGLMYKIRGSFGKKEINGKKVLCYCKNVTEDEVAKAITNGASSVEEVGRVTKAGTACGACKNEIKKMIANAEDKSKETIVCGCYKVSEASIVEAVKNGAKTVEEVGKVTKAGTGCGGCQPRIQQLIDANK